MEELIAGSQSSVCSQSLEENVIEELEDRRRRSTNLILYNLDESDGGNSTDVNLVSDIFRIIQPDMALDRNVLRLGRKRQGHTRPLRVSLPTKHDVLAILKNRARYTGPVSQDQTLKQKQHLKDL